jgi:hypothetical protein
MYAMKQELNFYELGMVALLQCRRERMFEEAGLLRVDRDLDQLTQIMVDLRDLEFQLQKWWHFEAHPHMHSWWCRIPYCECDNDYNNKSRQALAKGNREAKQAINKECPLHGRKTGFTLEEGFKNLDRNDMV